MTTNYSQKQFERPKYMETTKFDCPLRAKNWEAQVKGNTQFDSQEDTKLDCQLWGKTSLEASRRKHTI